MTTRPATGAAVLVVLVLLALVVLAGAALLYGYGVLMPAAPVHLGLAAGAMPLIFGAMLHFVPVLSRSAAPARTVQALPLAMLVAGALAFASFAFPVNPAGARDAAAGLGIAGAALLAVWIHRRGARSIGRPHPCLYWYLAAILCLALALSTVVLMRIWPEHYLALRRFHLHLNTLGFIGITAIGTLQVLVPTASGRPDPQAAQRLRSGLAWVVAGTLLVAVGSAVQVWLVWPGLILWLVPLLRLARAWWNLYRHEAFRLSGAVPALAAALCGFLLVLLHGAGHAAGVLSATGASAAYIAAFLFPLVTGAATHLLPVWIRPGPQTAWHAAARARLGYLGAVRALLFLGGGAALGLGAAWGLLPALAGWIMFIAQVLRSGPFQGWRRTTA